MSVSKCRFCNKPLEKSFLDLGRTPLSNSFVRVGDLTKRERFYPLHAYVCKHCLLVQIDKVETPKKIFSNYVYFSSYSKSWLKHSEEYVNLILNRFHFNKNSKIVEIASNDGYLLQYFMKKKIPVLGIEPAHNIAKIANDKGIPTITEFFGTKIAKRLIKDGVNADLIIGNNVLAHVPDLNDFVAGMKILLKKEGIITMEFPHLMKLIKHNQFDTLYHEHFSYFSFYTVQQVFNKQGLTIFDVDEIVTHGGSLRIYVKHSDNDKLVKTKRVRELQRKEKRFGINKLSTYSNFRKEAFRIKNELNRLLITMKMNNKKIVAYGAAAKGNTLLNFCNIGPDLIEYVVDANPHKQGLFLPGIHIEVKNPKEIYKTKPDYIIILPWNLKKEIINQLHFVRKWDCKFIIPIPRVKVIT